MFYSLPTTSSPGPHHPVARAVRNCFVNEFFAATTTSIPILLIHLAHRSITLHHLLGCTKVFCNQNHHPTPSPPLSKDKSPCSKVNILINLFISIIMLIQFDHLSTQLPHLAQKISQPLTQFTTHLLYKSG